MKSNKSPNILFKGYNKLNLSGEDIILTEMVFPIDIIYDWIKYKNKILLTNYYDYCTICGLEHDKLGMTHITTCSNPICVKKVYHYPITNKVIELYNLDSKTLFFLIRTLLSALKHPKIDKLNIPLPLINSIKTFSELRMIIPPKILDNNLDELIAFISSSYDDFNLWHNLNNNLIYALILNAISNNFYSLYSFTDLVNHNFKKKLLGDGTTVMDIDFFNVKYSTEIENKIKHQLDDKLKYYYLFHGSPFECWYSIIKNGLKVMSGTEFMTTGAAYGNGIYMSNHLNISTGYATSKILFEKYPYSMIGLFQIIVNPEIFKKTEGYYVITDEKTLILRTLIKINKPITNACYYNQLTDYFIRQQSIDNNMVEHNILAIKNKRLSAEIKLIEKKPDKYKIIEIYDETEKPWIIQLYVKDKTYTVEIYFFNYPVSSPLIKMLDFKEEPKGIIDKDFKINIPLLELGIWNIKNKIIEVLEIVNIFLEKNY
jgi:hypothetical protein